MALSQELLCDLEQAVSFSGFSISMSKSPSSSNAIATPPRLPLTGMRIGRNVPVWMMESSVFTVLKNPDTDN